MQNIMKTTENSIDNFEAKSKLHVSPGSKQRLDSIKLNQ